MLLKNANKQKIDSIVNDKLIRDRSFFQIHQHVSTIFSSLSKKFIAPLVSFSFSKENSITHSINVFDAMSVTTFASIFCSFRVTPDNERMQVNVFDEKNEQALGRMPLIEADHLAKYRELLLVLVDQSANPPDVRLMTGRRLAELREDARAKRPDEHEEQKYEEFVVRLRSHIADNDLQTKMSQASAAHLKGATLRILIDFDHNTDASVR